MLPDVREVLGPVSTCRSFSQVPKGISSRTVCLPRWIRTGYLPREDSSKTISSQKSGALCCPHTAGHDDLQVTTADDDDRNAAVEVHRVNVQML
jgi:hypothetical protein